MPDSPDRASEGHSEDGYFAPSQLVTTRISGGIVTWPRLVLRIATLLVVLAGVDTVVAQTIVPDTAFEDAYRLPGTLPTSSIASFRHSIHAASLAPENRPIVAFLGASPTWGHRIEDRRNTFPAAFETAAARGGWPNRTYNLACNGQFVSDEYIIAKSIVPDAHVVFVQLTYHTFNPEAREGAVIRYPELPDLLGTSVSPTEAALLGIEPITADSTASQAGATVGSRWLLWGERDAVNRRLFGGRPQSLLAPNGGSPRASLTSLPDDAARDGFDSFDALDPESQFIAVSRYAENSSFAIDPRDSEMHFLQLLVELLESHDKKAVFFMAPLNRTVIEDFELIDPDEYASNTGEIRSVVEDAGYPFIDFNTGPARLEADRFADISHTTDEGGKDVGSLLFDETREYLEGRP